MGFTKLEKPHICWVYASEVYKESHFEQSTWLGSYGIPYFPAYFFLNVI